VHAGRGTPRRRILRGGNRRKRNARYRRRVKQGRMWSARSGILGKRRRWVTSAMIPHLRLVLGAGIGNVLSTSQNLRRGWTTDPGPLSFGPTHPCLPMRKLLRISASRTHRPLNRLAMSLMLRSIADASYMYPQIHPRTTAINGTRSQLGWGKGSTFSGTFPDGLCSTGFNQCRRTNGFGSRLGQARP